MNKIKLIIIICFAIFSYCYSQVQSSNTAYITIPQIAILDIEPDTNPIYFVFEAENETGKPLKEPDINDKKWINYTSTRTVGGSYKNITANISNSSFIPGLLIDLTVFEKRGKGEVGNPVGLISLTTTAQIVVTDIGATYTENGGGKGHRLKYEVSLDYSQFSMPAVPSCEIIYTFSN